MVESAAVGAATDSTEPALLYRGQGQEGGRIPPPSLPAWQKSRPLTELAARTRQGLMRIDARPPDTGPARQLHVCRACDVFLSADVTDVTDVTDDLDAHRRAVVLEVVILRRLPVAARTHTFADLATAIDDAFARWDRAHLHLFERSERRLLTSPEWDDLPRAPSPAPESDSRRWSWASNSSTPSTSATTGPTWAPSPPPGSIRPRFSGSSRRDPAPTGAG